MGIFEKGQGTMTSLRHSRGADNIVMSILNNVATHFQSRKHQCSGQMLSYLHKQFWNRRPPGPGPKVICSVLSSPRFEV